MANLTSAKKAAAAKPVKTKTGSAVLSNDLTAKKFIERLNTYQSDEELKKIQRYFKSEKGDYGYGDKFMGVKMGNLFLLAKEFGEIASVNLNCGPASNA